MSSGLSCSRFSLAQRNTRVVLSLDRSNVSWAVIANQYVRLIRAPCYSGLPLPLHSVAPTPLALPHSFHGARTEALVRRTPLPVESLVAARPLATAVEKN